MSHDSNASVPDAEALTEELGRALWQAMPNGSDQIEYTVHAVASLLEEFADARTTDGLVPSSVPDSVTAVARRLRAAMYRPGAGTWFTASFTVTRAGGLDADFSYDDEPEWDVPIDPLLYSQDLQQFPRDDAAIPSWLRERVDRG